VREDGDDFLKRIVSAPPPGYPEVARKAGIEGVVRLQVRLKPDGHIEVRETSGRRYVLADAAIAGGETVAWQAGGNGWQPVDVISR